MLLSQLSTWYGHRYSVGLWSLNDVVLVQSPAGNRCVRVASSQVHGCAMLSLHLDSNDFRSPRSQASHHRRRRTVVYAWWKDRLLEKCTSRGFTDVMCLASKPSLPLTSPSSSLAAPSSVSPHGSTSHQSRASHPMPDAGLLFAALMLQCGAPLFLPRSLV